ncbi:MAG: class I SAM-dependent methyltransferase [Bacteriovoracaceae bacterium]|nr:class I SAM-dependent methyltransferase [Bacteriovoracaceae bacterium]
MIISKEIEHYAKAFSSQDSDLLQKLMQETHEKTTAPQMLSGPLVGQFLKILIGITQAKRVLEIGTFTGYSALSMAEALPLEGELFTCDVSAFNTEIAKSFFTQSPHGKKIKVILGPALETIETLQGIFDLVFIDADKKNYQHYYEMVFPKVKQGGLIVVDNCLWDGEVTHNEDKQDEMTRSIHHLNQRIAQDKRVEHIILTVRDGLHVVRKKI